MPQGDGAAADRPDWQEIAAQLRGRASSVLLHVSHAEQPLSMDIAKVRYAEQLVD